VKSFHRRASRPAPKPARAAAAPAVHHGGLRADQLLVERGLAPSRTAARRMIEAGRVSWSGGMIAKPAQELPPNAELRVVADEEDRYVSRGGIKLASVSFISLTLALPQLPPLLHNDGHMLLLVKPQLEMGTARLDKGSIVREPALYGQVEAKLRAACAECGLTVRDGFDSPITGAGVAHMSGNREFIV
jgi:predicted rRNA methylase YqxC with S4 and FtsJ domains